MANGGMEEQAILADAGLMARVAHGDAQAWHILTDQELPKAFHLAKRLLHHDQEAEDVTQEAFTRLWQQAGHWQPRARIATWLYRVVHNLAMDRLRLPPMSQEEMTMPEEESDPATSPLAMLERSDRQRILQQAMAALPLRQREALVLVHLMGVGLREAGQVMGVGREALDSLLARGRRRLRTLLSPLRKELLEP